MDTVLPNVYKGASVFETPIPSPSARPHQGHGTLGPDSMPMGIDCTATWSGWQRQSIPLVPSPAATTPPPPLSLLGSPPAFMPSALRYSDDIRATAAASGTS